MKKSGVSFLVAAMILLAAAPAAFAQHRYLGEGGAKIIQCARFYSSLQAQMLCVRGDELSAGQIEKLGLIDRNSRIGRQYGGNYGYDGGGDGYFYRTDSAGRPMGTQERIVTGGVIGATLGAGIGAIVGRGNTGALLGAGTGAIIGAVSDYRANKKTKEEVQIREANLRAVEVQGAQTERSLAQARAEQVEAASKEQKLLRNRFDAPVRLYFRTNDGQIEDLVLDPGQITKITLLRGTELIIAEVDTETGGWMRLEYGSGKIRLPRNSGWEFDPGS